MSNWLASQEGFSIQLKKWERVLIVFELVFSNATKLKLDAKCDQKNFKKEAWNLTFFLEKWEYSNKIYPFYFNLDKIFQPKENIAFTTFSSMCNSISKMELQIDELGNNNL
jgi:hypothetical protein